MPAQRLLEGFPPVQPIVDGHCVPEDPWRLVEAGRSHGGDLLVGSNADEGTFPYLRGRQYGVGLTSATEYSAYVRQRFGVGADAFFKVYPAESETDFKQAQLDAFSDEVAWSARFSASTHARQGRAKTWLYYFSHRPPAPSAGSDRGATHGAEILYAANSPRPNWTDADRRVGALMSAYWFNFAARGDPNGPGLPPWPPFVSRTAELALDLGPMAPRAALEPQRAAIFDELYRSVYGD